MNVPNNLKYTKNHEWVLIQGDQALIGITDFAQNELGDIVYVDVDTLDEELNFEEVFGTVEAVKTVSDLYMPLSGKIEELNPKLEDNPELLNSDPYGEGWIIKININDISAVEKLLDSDKYSQLVNS